MPVLKYRPDVSSPWQIVGTTVDGYSKEETDTLLAGKAPAGYGLGENSTYANLISDCNLATKNGWYWTYENVQNAPADYGFLHVCCNGGYIKQEWWATTTNGAQRLIRVCNGGTWTPWEWIDPPFITDTIYRTTERYNSQPVYKKQDSSGVIWWSIDQSTWKREYERTGAASYKTQQTVEKTTVPTIYIPSSTSSMAASELPAYLASLPRLVTDTLVIYVSGELNVELNINGFYGSGDIKIISSSSNFKVNQPVYISYCTVPIMLENVQIALQSGVSAYTGACSIKCCKYVRLDNCVLTGKKEKDIPGITIAEGGSLVCEGTSVSSFNTAINVQRSSVCSVYGTSEHFSDNTYGAYVWHGGIIMLNGTVPDALGGSTNLKQGGLIVKSDSTLL